MCHFHPDKNANLFDLNPFCIFTQKLILIHDMFNVHGSYIRKVRFWVYIFSSKRKCILLFVVNLILHIDPFIKEAFSKPIYY